MDSKRDKNLFFLYIIFGFIFYSIIFFFGGPLAYHHQRIPWYIFILRDIPFLLLNAYLGREYYLLNKNYKLRLRNYLFFVKLYIVIFSLYLLLAFFHLSQGIKNIAHYHMRNFLLYSTIILYIPFLFTSSISIENFIKNILKLVFFISLWGVLSRYISPKIFTFNFRITGTFPDPNIFGLILVFCILSCLELLNKKEFKYLWYLFLYIFALILTNSLASFFTLCVSLCFLVLFSNTKILAPVSYTHLTLPTKA